MLWSVTWQPNDEWWPMTLFIIAVYFSHHGEYPPSHIHPNPLHWDTGQQWIDTGDVEPGTQSNHATRTTTTWQGHSTTTTWQWGVTMTQGNEATTVHGNDNTWWQHDQDTGRRTWGNKGTTTCDDQVMMTTTRLPFPFNIPLAFNIFPTPPSLQHSLPINIPPSLNIPNILLPFNIPIPFNTPFPSTSPFPPTSPFPHTSSFPSTSPFP